MCAIAHVTFVLGGVFEAAAQAAGEIAPASSTNSTQSSQLAAAMAPDRRHIGKVRKLVKLRPTPERSQSTSEIAELRPMPAKIAGPVDVGMVFFCDASSRNRGQSRR